MIKGWRKVHIEDICDKGSSNIAQNKIEQNNGDYPLYGASGFIKNIDFYHQEKPYIGIVKDGSGVGRVNFYPAKTSLLGTLQYILPKPGHDIRFVGYALKSINLSSFASGAAIPHIYFKDYGKSSIYIPNNIEEQRRVADELDLLSGIIEKKNEQLKILDKLADSIFYEMFGDPVLNEKDWKTNKMKDVAPQKAFNGNIPSVDGKYWLLNLDMVESQTGRIIDKILYEPSDMGNSITSFNEENILYSKLRPYLNKVVIPTEPGYCTSELVPLHPKKDLIERTFLAYLIRNQFFVEYISSRVAGAKMPRVSMTDFREFDVIIPPLELQQSFSDKISVIDKLKSKIRVTLKPAEQLLASRMDKYFSE